MKNNNNGAHRRGYKGGLKETYKGGYKDAFTDGFTNNKVQKNPKR